MFPLDWQRNLIADGRFTVESDRATVVKLGEVALESAMVMDFSVVDQPMVSPKRRFFGVHWGGGWLISHKCWFLKVHLLISTWPLGN